MNVSADPLTLQKCPKCNRPNFAYRTRCMKCRYDFRQANIERQAERLAMQIHSEWDRIEQQAGQQGEVEQNTEAVEFHTIEELKKLIIPYLQEM